MGSGMWEMKVRARSEKVKLHKGKHEDERKSEFRGESLDIQVVRGGSNGGIGGHAIRN